MRGGWVLVMRIGGLVGSSQVVFSGVKTEELRDCKKMTNIILPCPQKISVLVRTSGEIMAINLIHMAHNSVISFM